jgi:serine/threonine-protein kinase
VLAPRRTPVLLVALALLACRGEPTAGGANRVRERWHQAQPGHSWARPAVAGDVVYFGAGDGQVIARDAATGAPRWAARVGLERVGGANVVVRGGVVVVSVVRHTVGLDAATGRELWRYEAPRDTGLGSSGNSGQVVATHLDADAQTVYVPAWGASISALDLRTGAVRWVWQPGRTPSDTAAAGRFRSGSMGVRVGGDTVFATAWHFLVENGVRSEAWLLALDRATGRELWRAVLPHARGGTVFGAPALAGPHVVFNTSEVRVYAVDRATGTLAWQFRADSTRRTPSSQVEASGDALYVDGGDSHLYALDARDGAVRWRGRFQTQTSADLLVTDRRVFLPSGGYLYVLDRASGRQVAEVTQPRTADPLFASPAAHAGGRVFATVNGAAWSFDEP